MNNATIVQKHWNACNVLRDDGMNYSDYPSLCSGQALSSSPICCSWKMADERSRPPYNQASPVLGGYDWPSLVKKDGDELFDHYRHTLEELGKQKGLLGLIFNKSQNNFDSRCFVAALNPRAPKGVQSPVEIVRTRPSCGSWHGSQL